MNMKFLMIILCSIFTVNLMAQTSNWTILSLVRYESDYDPETGIEKLKPEFSPRIDEIYGKEIELKGYLVPLDGKRNQSTFIFSAFPFSSCFFCGGAGPETVIEVRMKGGMSLKYSEEQITLKGKFRYRPQTEEGIFYALDNTILID